ncbi:MAG TPA: hypothetical protein VFZ34_27035 [Blastocatellia bacterium]|nr:hypothetical protein [Blastocatellia bacterium]
MNVLAGYIGTLAQWIEVLSFYLFGLVIVAIVLILLLRVVADSFKLNPFGKFAYYTTRPANQMIGHMRASQLYYPLKRALGFDPAILMVFFATVILCYVAYVLVGYLTISLWAIANTLIRLGVGDIVGLLRYVVGTVLLTVVFFLLFMMTVIMMYSFFGLLRKWVGFAYRRIGPLLQLFEQRLPFPGLGFLLLGLVLTFVAYAVQLTLLFDLRRV